MLGGKWFTMWFEDRQSVLETMQRNVVADLDAGYNPHGHSIRNQMVNIEKFKTEFNNRMEQFKHMEDEQVERWCYYDLKKRGAIS